MKLFSPTMRSLHFLTTILTFLYGCLSANAQEMTQFSNIYFIGGRCDDPESWYSRWTAAGLATLSNITHHFCCPYERGQYAEYTAEFHSESLLAAMDAAGNQRNSSVIITGAFAGVDYEEALVTVLQSGMAVVQGDGVELNLTKYNLSPDNVMYVRLVYEERSAAARKLGLELCRLKGGNSYLKIAKFYMEKRPDLDFRVDNVLAAFEGACPDTVINEVWSLRGERPFINSDAELQFSFKEIPDIIMTPTDDDAANLLGVAKSIITPEQYDILATTGWDNSWPSLLADRKILTTADQLVFYPQEGFWKSMKQLIGVVQKHGLNSTASMQQLLDFGNSSSTNTTVLAISSDKVGHILSGLMEGYDERSQPSSNVNISTGLYDVSITKVMPFEGKFDAVYSLRLAWLDNRLVWNPFLYSDTIEIDKEHVWHPRLLHFKNEYEKDDIFLSPAVVSYNGYVVLDTTMRSTFLCDTTRDIAGYPFDKYQCFIDLVGSGSYLHLDHAFGLDIIAVDPDFAMTSSVEMQSDQQGEQHVLFLMALERLQFTTWVRLVVPAILINMVGFISFWIKALDSSVALGITALLCSLAFRESVNMPETSDVTWSETFVMINISYQAIVMFIIFCSYSFVGRFLNTRIGCLRPEHGRQKGWWDNLRIHHEKVESQRNLNASNSSRYLENKYSSRRLKTDKSSSKSVRSTSSRTHLTRGDTSTVPLSEDSTWSLNTRDSSGPIVDTEVVRNDSEEEVWDEPEVGGGSSSFSRRPTLSRSNRGDLNVTIALPREDSPSCSLGSTQFSISEAIPENGDPENQRRNVPRQSSTVLRQRRTQMMNDSRNGTAPSSCDDDDDSPSQSDDESPSVAASDNTALARFAYSELRNVDWIGRWYVVPSYGIVMIVMLAFGDKLF